MSETRLLTLNPSPTQAGAYFVGRGTWPPILLRRPRQHRIEVGGKATPTLKLSAANPSEQGESLSTSSPSPFAERGAGGEVLLRLPDLLAILFLIVLCWLFFWRLLTPNPLNEQSLVEGDFSGQFVAFAQYQAVRLAAGERPLWNPDNNGGHPFLADTQSAVFFPPPLLTIAL